MALFSPRTEEERVYNEFGDLSQVSYRCKSGSRAFCRASLAAIISAAHRVNNLCIPITAVAPFHALPPIVSCAAEYHHPAQTDRLAEADQDAFKVPWRLGSVASPSAYRARTGGGIQ